MSEAAPRRFPRVLTCLVKGPLGCLAFLIGASAVTVLLLPPVGGRFLDRMAEEWFAENHAGRLELGDAWFGSFYGRQSIDSLILRDPDDAEILRASLDAPSLGRVLEDPEDAYPVHVRVPLLRLVASDDGGTNFARALASTADPSEHRRDGLRTDHELEFELEIEILRLRWADAHGKEGGLEGIQLDGKLTLGPDDTRLVLEGGTKGEGEGVRMQLACSWPELGLERPWAYECTFQGLPGPLAGVLCAELVPLAGALGVRVDELSVSGEGPRRSVRVVDDAARLELEGERVEGALVNDGTVASLKVPCAHARAAQVLERLLPLVAAVECEDERGVHALELRGGRWPLGEDLAELEGEFSLELAGARALPVPALRAWLGGDEPLALGGLRQNAHVRGGEVEYALFRMPFARGWIEVDGRRELARGAGAFDVRGERDGAALAPLHVEGALPRPGEPDGAPLPPVAPVPEDGEGR